MSVLALAQEHITMWWIALGMGLVVSLVVTVLLSLLVSFVNDIDGNVSGILETAGGIAGHTSKIPVLGETAELAGVLRDELGRHADVLASI